MKQPAVYIMASGRNGTLYTGVTSDLIRRVWQHKEGTSGFTARYGCKMLVWYEMHEDMLTPLRVRSRSKPDPEPRNSR